MKYKAEKQKNLKLMEVYYEKFYQGIVCDPGNWVVGSFEINKKIFFLKCLTGHAML